MLFIAIIFASLLASLIPAFVVKMLMSVFFGRRVSYLKVLGVMAVTYVTMSMGVTLMGYETEASFETMPDWVAITVIIATFVFQAILLWVAVTDEDGDVVPVLGWVIALVLQYVVYLLIGLLIIFAVM